jgi:large subunit ribosomal protein L6
MSRLGKTPLQIPAGVTIAVDNGVLEVKGPKATLSRPVRNDVTLTI